MLGRRKFQDYVVLKRVDKEIYVHLVEPMDKHGPCRVENRVIFVHASMLNISISMNNVRHIDKATGLKSNISDIDDSSSKEDDPVAIGFVGSNALKRSTRTTAGKHSNRENLSKSVLNSHVWFN